MSQTNTNPNLNLIIYAIKFQSCTLISSADNRQLMGYQEVWLEIEFIGKSFGSLWGGERKTMGSRCHCGILQITKFEKCSCGGGHQAKKLGKSQGIMNCGMHCPDPLLGKGWLP